MSRRRKNTRMLTREQRTVATAAREASPIHVEVLDEQKLAAFGVPTSVRVRCEVWVDVDPEEEGELHAVLTRRIKAAGVADPVMYLEACEDADEIRREEDAWSGLA